MQMYQWLMEIIENGKKYICNINDLWKFLVVEHNNKW